MKYLILAILFGLSNLSFAKKPNNQRADEIQTICIEKTEPAADGCNFTTCRICTDKKQQWSEGCWSTMAFCAEDVKEYNPEDFKL